MARSNEVPFGQKAQTGAAAATALRVLDYGPTGRVPSGLVQIKVRFARPVVALGADEEEAADGLLTVTPSLRGRLAWHGPDLLVLETTQPLPDATSFEVQLNPSLTSFDGLKLERPVAWRFETPRPTCQRVPLSTQQPAWLASSEPIVIRCTQAVSVARLSELTSVRVGDETWSLRIGDWTSERTRLNEWFTEQERPLRHSRFIHDRDADDRTYVLWPLRDWPVGADLLVTTKRGLRSNDGPLLSEEDQVWKLHVAPRPTAVDVACETDLRIRFSTRMTDEALDDVRIKPELDGSRSAVWQTHTPDDGGTTTWSARLGLATPGTHYTVTVPAGSQDSFGNRTSQDWQREIDCPISGPVTAIELGRSWEENVGVFEAAKPRTMILRTAGVKEVRLSFAPIDSARLLSDPELFWRLREWAMPSDPDTRGESDPTPKSEVPAFAISRAVPIVIEPDQGLDRTIINLTELPRGKLMAVRADAPTLPDPETGRALLQVTDLGLIGWLPQGKGMLQAVHLSTGLPWPDASVRASVDGKPWQDWGRSNAQGFVTVPAQPRSEDQARLLLLAQAGADQIVYDTSALGSSAEYGYFGSDEPHQPGLLGQMVLDRALYAPGEIVTFVGFAAEGRPDGDTVPLPAGTRLKVALTDSRVAPPVDVQIDERGKFWGRFRLPAQLPPTGPGGWQTLSASLEGAKAESEDGETTENPLRVTFRVATFRPLDVEVRTHMSKIVWGPGETPNLDVEARTLTGANAQLRSAVVVRTCQPSTDARFIKGWHVGMLNASHRIPVRDEYAVDTQALLRGRFHLDLPGLPIDVYRSTRCTADVTVQDQSLRSASAQVEYVQHSTPVVLGLRAKQADPTKRDLTVEATALTWDGERRAVRGVLISVRDEAHHRILRTQKADLPATLRFTDLPTDTYILTADGFDEGRPLRSETIVSVHRPERRIAHRHMPEEDLRIDHPELAHVGRPITFDLHVPEGVRAGMLAVVRGQVREVRAVRFHDQRARVTLVPQDSWYPASTVRLIAVMPGGKGRDPAAQVLSLESELKVSDEHRQLRIGLDGPKESAPGQEVDFAVSVRDDAGRAIAGAHLSAWAVDEGVLAIQPHEIPDFVAALTFDADNNVGLVNSLQRTLEPFREEELDGLTGSGSGYGRGTGGLGGRRARAPDVSPTPNLERARFEITPLFLGDAAADAQGRAHVRFRLPDNLTRFRISVLASAPVQADGPSLRFGTAESHLTVAQPLTLHPLLPRFLHAGDSSEATVVVQNLGTRSGQAEVSIALDGDVLSLQGPARKSVSLAVGQQRRISFPVRAEHDGSADVHLSARLDGNGQHLRDAVRRPIDVITEPEPLETVAMSGVQVGRGSVSIPTQLPVSALRDLDRGRWSIRLAGSLQGDLDDVLVSLIKYRYRCAEQTASHLLPFLLFPDHERVRDAQAQLSQALARLRQLQIKKDGGLGFWPGERALNPFATAWAALVIDHAQDADARTLLQELRMDLRQAVQGRAAKDWPLPDRALAVLALGPEARGLPELCDPAPHYAPLATGLAALAELNRTPDASARTRQWLSEALAQLPEHAQRLHANGHEAHGFPADDHVMAEIALSWALARVWPEHPARAKLARALAEHRRGGAFANTLENGLFLMFAAQTTPQASQATPGTITLAADQDVLAAAKPWPTPGRPIVENWPLRRLPQTFFQPGTGQFVIDARGEGDLFYGIEVSMAVADPTAAHDRGIDLATKLRPLDGDESSEGAIEAIAAGSLVALDLTLRTRARFENVVIDIPLPAGLEAVDSDSVAAGLGAEDDAVAYRDLAHAHRQLDRDRVVLFPRSLARGTTQHTVFLRALVPGDYVMPNAQAELMYSPDVRGRSAQTRVQVRPPSPGTH
jgi:hypothetical protein